ncbi:hemolysin family protein [Methanimicrococcus blatticola]|uniref:CBS domain containing-hemolysin-like protein n=1 Tax=Methanimicrococcus blatticola TaxID=91560 RepID=A0A484F2J7_9EURY|nr:hemolysin family protein [Methanimicrococcus blatticola]MBZ3935358.1 hemolysin family protein [Methanimicrococcus blatticola]MCC2508544.1 hemolysin family protein [Methanimicrococcus blatticola]TDQ67851.1 CBS domain containing-hemolysin-like protein [Methanimicrococcus blatticola]
MEIPLTFWYVLLFILLALSAFFSATETAYSTANKLRLKAMAENGNTAATRVLKITEDYDKFISTVLIGNNIVNIGASSIATILFARLFPEELAAAVSTVVVTVVVLIFGETLPKSIAKANAEKYALITSRVVGIIMVVFSPLAFILVKLINVFSRKKESEAPSVTEDELKYIIESIEEEGILEEDESDLVQSALDFDETTVQEIMTPRSNIVAININDDIDAILKIIIDEGYTRVPVYKDNLDDIRGIINVKDVLIRIATHKRVNIRALMKPVTFAYVTMNISPLLNEMRAAKSHLAVVVDDYGSTKGIVTMEDILEELVGEIWDEYDEIVEEIVEVDDDTYEVSGNMNIDDLFDYLEVDNRDFECNYNTAGGWALDVFERIPKAGDVFSYKNLRVTVLGADEQRVTKLKVEIMDEPISDEETKCGIEEKAEDPDSKTE